MNSLNSPAPMCLPCQNETTSATRTTVQ